MITAAEDMPEEAIEHNLKALELDPRNVDAWKNNRGRRSESGGRRAEDWGMIGTAPG
jgi:hypothetical protein